MFFFKPIKVFFIPLLLLALPTFALDDPRVLTQPRELKRPKRIARVRIPIKIRIYNKILVKKLHGKIEDFFRPSSFRSYRLRARIDKKNDFYLGGWHIESIPVKWSRAKLYWEVKLRFHKRYGKKRGLEEFVGTTYVAGLVDGKNFLYNFQGKKGLKFKNTLGQPIADILIGPPDEKGLAKNKPGKRSTL